MQFTCFSSGMKESKQHQGAGTSWQLPSDHFFTRLKASLVRSELDAHLGPSALGDKWQNDSMI